jgi:hypothetical protein
MGRTEVSKAVAIFFIRRMQEIALSALKEKHKDFDHVPLSGNLWE